MSHFYGTIEGNRGEATRGGTKASGLVAQVASWSGAIRVHVKYDEVTGRNHFTVYQIPWRGAGIRERIAEGIVGQESKS